MHDCLILLDSQQYTIITTCICLFFLCPSWSLSETKSYFVNSSWPCTHLSTIWFRKWASPEKIEVVRHLSSITPWCSYLINLFIIFTENNGIELESNKPTQLTYKLLDLNHSGSILCASQASAGTSYATSTLIVYGKLLTTRCSKCVQLVSHMVLMHLYASSLLYPLFACSENLLWYSG